MLTFVIQSHRGVEQLVARRAHNPEAGGSSPSPATRTRMLRNQRPCFLCPHSPQSHAGARFHQSEMCWNNFKTVSK